jgi:DNA (cytosine-5)-methyltransferase 1
VFVIASARTDIDPAEILFERESLSGNPAPSREAKEDVAGTFKACASSGGWSNSVDHAAAGYMQPGNTYQNVSHCLNAGGMGRIDYETESFVVHGTQDPCVSDSIAFALGRNNGAENAVYERLAVRRLTPVECEFLQGFPRNHTHVPYRNKPATDGPRYKAIGNSMAVPCMAWIGSRLTALMGVASCS